MTSTTEPQDPEQPASEVGCGSGYHAFNWAGNWPPSRLAITTCAACGSGARWDDAKGWTITYVSKAAQVWAERDRYREAIKDHKAGLEATPGDPNDHDVALWSVLA